MSEPLDLWAADIGVSDVKFPITYLKEQAAALERRTKSVLRGEITTSRVGNELVHTFNLVAPALDHYSYMLFRIRHGIEVFPVSAFWNNTSYEADNDVEFQELLSTILSDKSTSRVVASLLSQAKAEV